MVLPLLGFGAALMGGAQYLLKKQDDKDAQSMLAEAQQRMAGNDPYSQNWGGTYLDAMNQIAGETGFFSDADKTQRMKSLLNDFSVRQTQAGIDQQMAMQQEQQARIARGDELSGQFMQEHQKAFGDVAVLQDAFAKGRNALESNTTADVIAGMYNFYNIVEPGGIVRDSEAGEYRSTGSQHDQFVNMLNKLRGEGINDTSRRELYQAMENQYKGRFSRAQRQLEHLNKRREQWAQRGYTVRDTQGSLGIDWRDPSEYRPAFMGPGGSTATGGGNTGGNTGGPPPLKPPPGYSVIQPRDVPDPFGAMLRENSAWMRGDEY